MVSGSANMCFSSGANCLNGVSFTQTCAGTTITTTLSGVYLQPRQPPASISEYHALFHLQLEVTAPAWETYLEVVATVV